MARISRICLRCKFKDSMEDDGQHVKVCPKCDGAFVDAWRSETYRKNNQTPLLTIELQNESSAPKFIYKGKEIKFKRNISFEYNSDAESPGGLFYSVEHFEDGGWTKKERECIQSAPGS